ncbi:toprim domain-containing protein [Primorskyibacter flagellatus]|nr:toprim domain-containing protein [Primorskyibacter flagellatus]
MRRHQTALTISDAGGKLLLHCKKSDCAFRDILAAGGIVSGNVAPPDPFEIPRREAARRAKAVNRAVQARRIWDATQSIGGSLAEIYLRTRGITCPLPETLRFQSACWHGATATRHPALVALVVGGDGFAVHRTYLRSDGRGKAAIKPAKAMLGAVAGGAVRLSDIPGALAVAEGIETALSLSCGLLQDPATVWAALSTSGMRALSLPSKPGQLIVASDGDPAGQAAAVALAERAHATGWDVSLLPAPNRCDWNDVLITKRGTA